MKKIGQFILHWLAMWAIAHISPLIVIMLGFVAHYEDKGEGGIGFLIGEIIIGIFALMITIARYDDLVKDDTTEDSTEIPQPIPEKTFDNSSPLKNLLRKI